MGDRAVITTKEKKIGIYLHWNGGRDSIEAFLMYCQLKGYRAPDKDFYGWARLCQVISNFFGGDSSIGIDLYERLDTDNGDNGVYVIENWKIVDRLFFEGTEQKAYDPLEFLKEINRCMPEQEQIDVNEIVDFLNTKISLEV